MAHTAKRKRLPDERRSIVHDFEIGKVCCTIRVGLYADGSPGELFIDIEKEGSELSGWADNFAIAISMGLQYGAPLDVLCDKFKHTRFAPQGVVRGSNKIRMTSSPLDYIFKWLELTFPAKLEG